MSVLVVDDEPLIGKIIARFLDRRAIAVRVATSGQDALDQLAAQPADVVLADLSMPGMSGLQIAERIHERWPETRCGLLAALPWPHGLLDAVKRGIVHKILAKPLDRGALEVAVVELMSEGLAKS